LENPEKVKSKLEHPVSAFEMRVCFGKIGHLYLFGIPVESFPTELTGDYTEAQGFSRGSGIIKPGSNVPLLTNKNARLSKKAGSITYSLGK